MAEQSRSYQPLSHVADIVETLKHSGRQHALVIEVDSSCGKSAIRGIFSVSQISRQLGVNVRSNALSDTFSDIEHAISAQS